MDTTLLENQSLELKAAAKDFQRLIDQQIALFRNEKEEHKKTVEKLNSMLLINGISVIRQYPGNQR